MSYRPIIFVIGILLLILSASMLLPVVIDLSVGNDDWRVFAGSQCVTGFFGLALALTTYQARMTLNIKQAFLLTNLSWLTISAFGALPFYFSDVGISYTDAFFETVSGLTTTGSTIMPDVEILPPGILFWRALLHFLGGIGIMVMAVAILPFLHIGGMQLFKAEAFDVEKVLPSAAKISGYISIVYIILTLICAFLFSLAGMSGFDAFTHAMGALSTGGFSNYNDSFAHFDSAAIDYIAIVFMALGSLNFILYLHAIKGDYLRPFKDSQSVWFFGIAIGISALSVAYMMAVNGWDFFESVRHSLFSVVSIMSTTGYVSTDYSQWGGFIVALFFFTTFIGACSGSTAGGIKIFRFQVLYAVARAQTKKMISPHGVFPVYYNGRPIPRDIPIAVMSFFFLFTLTYAILVIALQLCGLDFITASSGAITALSNVGPGFGPIIGPVGDFSSLPDNAIWLLSAGMLLGRLELFTCLVMLSPRFWRR